MLLLLLLLMRVVVVMMLMGAMEWEWRREGTDSRVCIQKREREKRPSATTVGF